MTVASIRMLALLLGLSLTLSKDIYRCPGNVLTDSPDSDDCIRVMRATEISQYEISKNQARNEELSRKRFESLCGTDAVKLWARCGHEWDSANAKDRADAAKTIALMIWPTLEPDSRQHLRRALSLNLCLNASFNDAPWRDTRKILDSAIGCSLLIAE